MMGFLKCPRSSWASKLDAHPLVFLKSFHILLALVHHLYGNPYSFTLISIDEHLQSSLIFLVNVTIFSLFALQPPPHSIPLIVLKPWLTLMYCVRVEKVWESKGVKTITWPIPGLCMIYISCVRMMQHSHTIWFCRDNFLWPCYFEKTWLLC